ncbi:unnamed protein product [Candidula unifasciata]|uniref:Cytochrome P450 n=1 Tax=Candidula unifasciata TaxID=100452 RepID=A0A8S4A9R2_9EUPU|nr:unnamed protein product [Candidula unifasciata]
MQIPLLYEILGEVTITQLLTATLFLLIALYYVYATRHHGVWEKLGVPGPKPWPIIDHKLELKGGADAAVKKWFKIYGNTFGAYGLLPHRAVLFTKDLSLVKEILVKDFDNFMERSRARQTRSTLKYGLTSITGDKWKRTRHVTSPMFTGSRLKIILRHICDSAETLTKLARLNSQKGQLIPLKFFATKFATEVIARIAFGVETHAVSEEETEFAYYARNIVIFNSKFLSNVNKVGQYFPHIENILRIFNVSTDFVRKEADEYFVSLLTSTIEDRKRKGLVSGNDKPRDLLDMMIKAGVENNDPRLADPESKSLSHDEILGNSIMLIMAGVETVSTTFQSLFYCLALHEDIQEKVIAEIDQVFPKGTPVDYEQLKDLKYTEQVINECLRLFPLVSTIMRVAAETKTYGNITIPKGTFVHITLGEIMKDPEHWPDPEKFDPDRFSPENKAGRDPLAFVPFGYGPRICLGMRLAIMELKTVLVYLLREQRFILSDKTEPKKGTKLKMDMSGVFLLRPRTPIKLESVPRE